MKIRYGLTVRLPSFLVKIILILFQEFQTNQVEIKPPKTDISRITQIYFIYFFKQRSTEVICLSDMSSAIYHTACLLFFLDFIKKTFAVKVCPGSDTKECVVSQLVQF